MHSPQEIHVESPIGELRSKAMPRGITFFPCGQGQKLVFNFVRSREMQRVAEDAGGRDPTAMARGRIVLCRARRGAFSRKRALGSAGRFSAKRFQFRSRRNSGWARARRRMVRHHQFQNSFCAPAKNFFPEFVTTFMPGSTGRNAGSGRARARAGYPRRKAGRRPTGVWALQMAKVWECLKPFIAPRASKTTRACGHADGLAVEDDVNEARRWW